MKQQRPGHTDLALTWLAHLILGTRPQQSKFLLLGISQVGRVSAVKMGHVFRALSPGRCRSFSHDGELTLSVQRPLIERYG